MNARLRNFRTVRGALIPVKVMDDLSKLSEHLPVRVTVTGTSYDALGYPYGLVFETSPLWLEKKGRAR